MKQRHWYKDPEAWVQRRRRRTIRFELDLDRYNVSQFQKSRATMAKRVKDSLTICLQGEQSKEFIKRLSSETERSKQESILDELFANYPISSDEYDPAHDFLMDCLDDIMKEIAKPNA